MSKSEKVFSVSDSFKIRTGPIVLSGSKPEGMPSLSQAELEAKIGIQVELYLPDGQRVRIRPLGVERRHGCFSDEVIYLVGIDPETIPEGFEITQGTEVWSLPD